MPPQSTSRARFGQVGGGPNAFIGAVHRMAARLDDKCELCAGAFSSDPEVSREFGTELGLATDRCYGSWQEMLEKERELPVDRRIEFVNIVTPNHLHAPVAQRALELGFHVLCDKPLCHSVAEAEALEQTHRSGSYPSTGTDRPQAPLFGVTYNYSGYPMIREARQRIASGQLGQVRKVLVEYHQGWLAERIEVDEQKQAAWRTDPKRAGAGGAMGDIGTHAAHLAEFVVGQNIKAVCADLAATVQGRVLDDDASVLLRFKDQTPGVLTATQIAVGKENGLRLRIFAEKGSLDWSQEEPNSLLLDTLGNDQPRQVLRSGGPGLSDVALEALRLPAGHPEGFLEAFANLYVDFAEAVIARRTDPASTPKWTPGLADGLRGMKFVEACVESSAGGQRWVNF